FHRFLTLFHPRTAKPADQSDQGKSKVGPMLPVGKPALARVGGGKKERPNHVNTFEMEVPQRRPNLERPMDEQEHVPNQHPDHPCSLFILRWGRSCECGMRNAECGREESERISSFCIPHSAFRI